MPDTFTFEEASEAPKTFSFEDAAPKSFSFEDAIKTPEFDAESAQQPRLTPQDLETATAPWYKPPPEWQKELIGHIDIPNAKNPALAPIVSLARAGAGIVNYFQTPQGLTEAGATLTPAAPAVFAKWAVDMVEGGYMSLKELGNSVAGLIGAGITHGMIGPNQLGVSPDSSHKEITERIQDISDNAVNAALQAASALGAAKGAVAEAKYLPKRFEPFQPPEPKLTIEDRGRLLNEMAQQYTDKMAADERLAAEARAQAEAGSPFTRTAPPQEPVTMGMESRRIPDLGTPPTFEPSRLGRPLEKAEIPAEESAAIEPGGEAGEGVGTAAQSVREMAAQRVRNDDFVKAVAEKVLQEHEPPIHPDKPLTDNQLRIIADSLTQSIADNQIPGPKKGIIAGSALEKWADDTLQFNRGTFYTGGMVQLVAAALVKGVALLEKGITKFSDWAAEMIKEHGDAIRPHLKQLFIQATEERAKAFQKPKEEIAPETQQSTPKPTTPAPVPTQPGPTARAFGPTARSVTAGPPVIPTSQTTPSLISRLIPGELRARFSDIGKDSKPLENLFTRTVNASTDAKTVVNNFVRQAFGKDKKEQDRLVKDFVALGWDNRKQELQSRGIPATQVPSLSQADINRIRSDPRIQDAIALWNKEIAPMISDIRTRNQMIMSPNWGSRDLMLNLPGEYQPGFQGKPGINPADVYNMPAKGESALQRDPVEALNQVVGGHLRYDAAQQLVAQIKKEAIDPRTVKSSNGKSDPQLFQEPVKGEKYTAPYKGRTVEVEAIDLSPDKNAKDLHYVTKPVADAWEHRRQERGNYNTLGDRILGGTFITGGVLTGSFAPHVYRELTAVASRIAQSGQSWWSVLPSWLGSNEYALYRMVHDMRDTPYGHLMQRIVDRTGADRGTGFVPEPESKIGKAIAENKVLGKLRPHELLFNPNYGIDVMARRTIADASLIKKIGLDVMRQLEKDVNSGKIAVSKALDFIESKLSDKEMVSVGREVNNTMGYGNPQTRAQTLNWAQRILPFVASESGKIPDEIRRLTTLNISPSAIKGAAKRGEYAQLAKSFAGSLANGTAGIYLTISALNYLLNGKPVSDNPEGRKTDVQIGKDLYWSNLDPGLARASRLTGGKEIANDPHHFPAYKREFLNEAFSVIHPFARWMFTFLSGKSGYMMPNGEFPDARLSDKIPISVGREYLNAKESHKPIAPAIAKDVARLGGIQLAGAPPSKAKIEGAKRNSAIDTVAREAKRLPLHERRDYVIRELSKQGYWDSHAKARLGRIYPGLFKYDD